MSSYCPKLRKVFTFVIAGLFLFNSACSGVNLSSNNSTLAPSPIVFQNTFIPENSTEFKESVLADIKFMTVTSFVASYFLEKAQDISAFPKAMHDKFRNTRDFLEGIDLNGIRVEEGIIYIPFGRDGRQLEAVVCSKEKFASLDLTDSIWGESDKFGILVVEKGKENPDKDIKDSTASKSNPVIQKLIKEGNMLEIAYSSDKNKLVANRIIYFEGYEAGTTVRHTQQYKGPETYKGEEVPLEEILNEGQVEILMNWIKSEKHKVMDEYVKFRIALGMPALGWETHSGGAKHINITHAGRRDKVIHIGQEFLHHILNELAPGTTEEQILEHELRHITDKDFECTQDPNYSDILQKSRGIVDTLILKGASHRTVRDFENEEGLAMGEEGRIPVGTTDLEIIELDPEEVDIELSLADDISFLPNRFNCWNGIVRDKMVARIIVPRNRFHTKPVGGITRQELVLPADDIGDSFREMRESTYTPSRNDHLDGKGLDYQDLGNDPNFIGYVGNGNLLMNPRIVGWREGEFIHLEGEPIDRPYPCLVRFKDFEDEQIKAFPEDVQKILKEGRTQIRKLRFDNDGATVVDIDVETGKETVITHILSFASSGIGIMENEQNSNILKFIIKGEESEDNELWQDYDIRHYLALPFLGGKRGAFAMDQFYPVGGRPDIDLIERAVRGEVVSLDYKDDYKDILIRTVKRMGYKEIFEGTKDEDYGTFDFSLDGKNKKIKFRLQPALYPNNICVQTTDNKIVFVIAQGFSSSKGIAFIDIPRMLKEIGIKAKNVIVFDNGGDAMLNFRGVSVAPSFNNRDRIMNMFVFKKRFGKKDRGMGKAKDELEAGKRRVKFLRSLHRYVLDKKREDPQVSFSLIERFIYENGHFIADQIEKALDVMESYIKEEAYGGNKPNEESRVKEREVRRRVNNMVRAINFGVDNFSGVQSQNIEGLFEDAFDLDEFFVEVVRTMENIGSSDFSDKEIEVLKEIWRLKTASIFAKFLAGGDIVKYKDLEEDTGLEERLKIYNDDVEMLLDFTRQLREKNMALRYGVKDNKWKEGLGITTARAKVEYCKPKEGYTASEIEQKALSALRRRDLRGTNLNRSIENLPGSGDVKSLAKMVADGKPFSQADDKTMEKWSLSDSTSIYTNGWHDIWADERIIFTSDKVVCYLTKNDDIKIVICGNKSKKDISEITIMLNDDDNVMSVDESTPTKNMALSRTTMAIQLMDSGIFDLYPELEKVLEEHLVWEKVSTESRERDLIDTSEIDYELIRHALEKPNDEFLPEQILKLIDLKYCKSRIVRQHALQAIKKIYDSGNPFFTTSVKNGKDERQSDDDAMLMIMLEFMLQDIEEDFRVIERTIRNNRSFIRETFKNIFDEKISIKDIESVKIDYLRRDENRQVYIATFMLSEEASQKLKKGDDQRICCLTLTRDDNLSEGGLTRDALGKATKRALGLLGRGLRGIIPQLGGVFDEIGYRIKILADYHGEKKPLENNIHLEASEFIEGSTLAEVLADEEISGAEKREALRACIKAAIKLYNDSKKETSIGHYIKHPIESDFVLSRGDRESEWTATIVNISELDECHSLSELQRSFKGFSKSKFFDEKMIKEEIKLEGQSELSSRIREFVRKGEMVEIVYTEGKLQAHKVVTADNYEPGSDKPELTTLEEKCAMPRFLDSGRQSTLIDWIKTHRIGENKEFVKFRIASNNVDLGWLDDNDHVNVALSEYADKCIYIGDSLLEKLLDSPIEREFILDKDIYKHLKSPASKPHGDDKDYIRRLGMVARIDKELLPRKKHAEKDASEMDINESGLDEAVKYVAKSNTYVFDLDYTLNKARSMPITEELADMLYSMIVNKNKKVRIVSGRSLGDFKRQGLIEPLIKRLRRKNKEFDLWIYSSDGAERSRVEKDGTIITPADDEYNKDNRFTDYEAKIIMEVLNESHDRIDEEQGLSRIGIGKFIENAGNTKFAYSPYGKYDESQYDFETKTELAQAYHPARLTRKKLGEILLEKIESKNITDVDVIISGKTTIGFVKLGANKRAAMEEIIKEDCKGETDIAIYFGDEMGKITDSSGHEKTGNDYRIAEMAAEGHEKLKVVSLNDIKSPAKIPDGVLQVGRLYLGTLQVLRDAYKQMQKNDPQEIKIVSEKEKLFALSAVKSPPEIIEPHEEGVGIHDKYYKITTKDENSYIFNYANDFYFPADSRVPESLLPERLLNVARHEVWMVNKLEEEGIRNDVTLVKKAKPQGWEKEKEDQFIYLVKLTADGEVPVEGDFDFTEPYRAYVLYKFIEPNPERGIASGSFDSLTPKQFRNMVRMVARIHKIFLREKSPYTRPYYRMNITDIVNHQVTLRYIKEKVDKKLEALKEIKEEGDRERSEEDPAGITSRGEIFISENVDFIISQMQETARNLDLQKLRKIDIHGDPCPSNFIFEMDNTIGIVDWEHSRKEAMVMDLAHLIRAGDPKGRFDIEGMKELVFTYNEENPLTDEEIKALPEIFRVNLLERLSRIATPRRYFESMGFEFSDKQDEDTWAIELMDNDEDLFKWHIELVAALHNLHDIISRGDFKREIIDPLLKWDARNGDAEYIYKKPRRPAKKSHVVIKECLDEIKSEAGKAGADVLEIRALSSFGSVKYMIEESKTIPIVEYYEENRDKWEKDRPYYTNGWARLQEGDKIIFDSNNVVIYHSENNNIYIAIRGDDDERAKQGLDRALIGISLNPDDTIRDLGRRPVGNYDLSRSSIAIQLTNVGFFKKFPNLGEAIRYKLIWEDVNDNLRYREKMDSSSTDMVLLTRAVNNPEGVTDGEIRRIEEFVYIKSKAIRRKALESLAVLYDVGRIGLEDFKKSVFDFINNDIEEDKRIIERGVKNDQNFLKELMFNLFGDKAGANDITKIVIKYIDGDEEKEIFKAKIHVDINGQTEIRSIILSLIRHDLFTTKVDQKALQKSIKAWKEISQGQMDVRLQGTYVPVFLGSFWERDYRARIVKLTEKGTSVSNLQWENKIAVIAREYVEGDTLEEILGSDKDEAQKSLAVEACRQCLVSLFNETDSTLGKGYSIEDPEPGQFVLKEENGQYQATLVDLDRLVHFPDERTVERLFIENIARYCMPGKIANGRTLEEILDDKEISWSEKMRAVHIAKRASLDLFEKTKEVLKEGYFMKNPDSSQFVLEKQGENWAVWIRDMSNLVPYPESQAVINVFYKSIEDEAFKYKKEIARCLETIYYSSRLREKLEEKSDISIKDDIFPEIYPATSGDDLQKEIDILRKLKILEDGNEEGTCRLHWQLYELVPSERDSFIEEIITRRIETLLGSVTKKGLKGSSISDQVIESERDKIQALLTKKYRRKNAHLTYRYIGISINGDKLAISINDGNNNIVGGPYELKWGTDERFDRGQIRNRTRMAAKAEEIMDLIGGVKSAEKTKTILLNILEEKGRQRYVMLYHVIDKTDAKGKKRDEFIREILIALNSHPKRDQVEKEMEGLLEEAKLDGAIMDLLIDGKIDIRAVKVVSASLAGPVDEVHGILGTDFPAPNLPFDKYPFREELQERLAINNIEVKNIFMANDSEAAVNGERFSPEGKLQKDSGGIVIIGGGINIAVFDKSIPSTNVPREVQNIRECGHNLIQVRDKLTGKVYYQWVGDRTEGKHPIEKGNDPKEIASKSREIGEKYNELCERLGEEKGVEAFRNQFPGYPIIEWGDGMRDFEDRLSGPNIRRRLEEAIRSADPRSEDYDDYMMIKKIGLDADLVKRTGEYERALTIAAQEGNAVAIRWIEEIASEIGRALAAFISAYQKYDFVNNLVLVSGINENMGEGVYYEGDDESKGPDIYIKNIRESAIDEMTRQFKILSADAKTYAEGICRSNMNYKRELVSYQPSEGDVFAVYNLVTSSAMKNSVGDCLKTIYCSKQLREKTDIMVLADLWSERVPLKSDAVYKEVEMLKALNILVDGAEPYTYQLRKEVREMPKEVIKQILMIPELDLSEIPAEEISVVREKVEEIIRRYKVEKARTEYRYIGISMGGNKLAISINDGNSKIIAGPSELRWDSDERFKDGKIKDVSLAEEVMDVIVQKVIKLLNKKGINPAKVNVVACGLAGPVNKETGIFGSDFKTPNLPFANYPFREELAKRLKKHGIVAEIPMFNDGEASLNGERFSPEGGLQGKPGGIVIIGGGINITVPDPNIKESGHNLYQISNEPDNIHYVWGGHLTKGGHPIERGNSPDEIKNKSGDMGEEYVRDGEETFVANHPNYPFIEWGDGMRDFEDRLSGPNIRERLEEAINSVTSDSEDYEEYMRIKAVGLDASQVQRPGEYERALTVEAQKGNTVAIKWIKTVANEIGQALAAFIGAHKDRDFVQNLVLVSGINENLGKDVHEGGEDWSGDLDIFIKYIRQNAERELVDRFKLEEKKAKSLTQGIVRSAMNYKRELVAYQPSDDEVLSGVQENRAAKGSIGDCLKTIYYSSRLKEKRDISVRDDLMSERVPFKKTTVFQEVRMLKILNLLVAGTKPHTYQLRKEVREMPEDVFDRILMLAEMDHPNIPADKIGKVKEKVEKIIEEYLLQKARAGYRYIGVSMGGNKLAISINDGNNNIVAPVSELRWDSDARFKDGKVKDASLAEEVMDVISQRIIALLSENNIAPEEISVVACGLAGPLNKETGVFGSDFKTPNLPFDRYPFRESLAKRLRAHGITAETPMFNDGEASLNGERFSPEGGLKGKSGGIVIIGGGINITVPDENIKESGHNLYQISNQPGDIHYLWAGHITRGGHPIERGNTPEAIMMKSGDMGREYVELGEGAFRAKHKDYDAFIEWERGMRDFEDRLSGPNIRARLKEAIEEVQRNRPDSEEYDEYMRIKNAGLDAGQVERAGEYERALTIEAERGNTVAIKWIKDIADEIGLALAAFIGAHKDRDFVQNLVLVSGINENLGKGIYENGEDWSGDLDIFIKYIRQSAKRELVKRFEMDEEEADSLADGIVRSEMNYTRELVAYQPTDGEIRTSHESRMKRLKYASRSGQYRKESYKMEAVHAIDMEVIPPVEKGKVLWHVIPTDLIPNSFKSLDFIRKVNEIQESLPGLKEKIRFVTNGSNLRRVVEELSQDKNNIVDVAVNNTRDLETIKEFGVRALVFEGERGGYESFKQLEVIIAALRALERNDTRTLIELHNMFSDEPFSLSEEDLLACLDDPAALAKRITFNLGPVEIKNPSELQELNERLLEFIQSA